MDIRGKFLRLTSVATLVVGVQLLTPGIAEAATVTSSPFPANILRSQFNEARSPRLNLRINGYQPPDNGQPGDTGDTGTRYERSKLPSIN